MTKRHWKAGLSAADFARVQTDPRLPSLMALGRVSNALSLSHHSFFQPNRWQTPRARKLRTAGLLYAGAVLFEGLRVAETLGAHFRHLPQYRSGFQPILADPQVQQLRSEFLKPLRDQFTFHFDQKVPATVLAKLNEPSEVVFFSAKEETAGGTYFDFADTLSIQHLIGEVDSDAEMQARMKVFMYGTTDLFKRFTIASQRLLAAAFFELGVRALP